MTCSFGLSVVRRGFVAAGLVLAGLSVGAQTSRPVVKRGPAGGVQPSFATVPSTSSGRFHPHPNGPTGPVVNAVNFGAAEVGGTPVTMTLSYAGSSSTLTAALSVGLEFAVTGSSCTATACTATVKFTPAFPGRREDALTFTDSNNNAVYKTYLRGLGNAPQLRFDLGGYSSYNGFTSSTPQTIAVAPGGAVYVTEANSNQILVLPVVGNITSFALTGLASPGGVVVDGSNILYVADQTNNTIISYNLTTQFQANVTTTPLSGPGQLAVDGTGALYIADSGHGRVIKIDNQGAETTVATGLNQPSAVAVDSAGNICFADFANGGEVLEIASGSTQTTTVASNLSQNPRSLAVGADGVVYLTTEQGLQRFYQGSSTGTEGSNNGGPFGLALKPNGGVLFTTPGSNNFTIIDPQNGANFILSSAPGVQTQGTFDVSNTGNESLTLANLVTDDSRYVIDSSSGCQPGTVLGPQQVCHVTVDFTPDIATQSTGHVIVTSNNLRLQGSSATFNVYGQGNGDSSHTDLTAAPSAVMVGNPVRLLANVVDDGGLQHPSGTVTFYDDGVSIGSANLSPGNGHVEITVSNLAVGTHTLTAQYSGDTVVDSNTSNEVTLVVSSGPPDPNNGVSVGSHDFGTAAVGSNGGTYNFSYQQNNEGISASGDFMLGQSSCDVTCTVTVTFKPQYPGLRQGVIERISTGQVVSLLYAYGIGTSPQLGFNSGTDGVYSNGNLPSPTAIALSPTGEEYIIDSSNNKIVDITDDGPEPLPIVNLATPAGVAVGPDGKVYVSDSTNNLIFTYDPDSQQEGVLATSQLAQPTGLAINGMGDVFILDAGNNRIIKVTAQGVETTVVSNVTNLASIALDSAGNVYYGTVTGTNSQGVSEVPAGGGQPTQTFTGEGPVHALAVDASGAFYFQNDNFTNIFPPPPQNQFLLGYQFPGNMGNRQTGLALGANGDVFATDSDSGQYFHSNRSTGNMYAFVNVGSSGNATATVFNDGNASLTISAITVSGTTFTIQSSSTCSAGTVLPPGGNCTVTAKYTPTQPGENHESLTFTSNSLNQTGATNMFDLYGEASNPPQATTTVLTYAPSNPGAGQTVMLTATVTGPASSIIPPSGQVTLMEGSTTLGTANLGYQTSGNTASASFGASGLSQGSHSITAVYAGDPNYLTSTSAAVTFTVGTAPIVQTTSQNFGNVPVGQQSSQPVTVHLPNPGNYYGPQDGTNFVLGGSVCNSSGCDISVYFKPNTPGLKTDSIVQKDQYGAVIARSFLYGVGTGPQFGFLPGSSSIDTTYRYPTTITFDAQGVGYVTDAATNKVYPLYTGAQPLPIVGLGHPGGIALDGGGTFYVADRDNNVIRTYNRYSNLQGTLPTTGLNVPVGVAVDGLGNVFIADTGNNRIVMVSNQGVQSTLVGSANTPQAVAVDSSNNIYYSSLDNNGQIIKIPAGGGAPVTIASFIGGTPTGLAVDASGSVYYVGNTFAGIRDVVPGVGQIAFSGQNAGGHSGLGLNFNGDIWTTQDSNGMLEQLHRGTAVFTSTTPVGTPKQHTVQVVNTGNAPLTLSNVAFSSATAFSLGAGSPCASGSVLQPGSECDTYVVFNPPTAQTYTSFLNYTSDTLNASGSVNTDGEVGNGTQPNPVPTTTTLNAAPTSNNAGGYIDFTATVTDIYSVTPTGTVSFYDGSTLIGSGTLSAGQSGSATAGFSTNSLAVGSHSITAVYGGASGIASSTSSPQTVTITAAPPASTTTVLTLSSGIDPYTTPITFTASVFDVNNAPITIGQVIFCDAATASRCNLNNNLGIAQLTSAGTAITKFAPGSIRNHSYVAKFIGTASARASASTAQSTVVTGTYPTVTTLSSTGNPGAYNLTATVVGTGTTSASPSGSITFTDTTNSNATLGTATLGAGTAAFSEKQPSGSPVTVGNGPYGVATGDFNGDGIPDVVFENYNAGTVSVLLGNGNGTFQSAVTYTVGTQPERVMVADFNGDGKLDLVVANTGSNTVSILLGNGDGTFRAQATYPVSSPVGLGVLDLNHDGIPDIAAASYYSNQVGILIGNGDGTFKPVVYYATRVNPQSLAEGDFNGDGNIDIVTGNVGAANISVFLGNGDGTFQSGQAIPTYSQPQGIAVGDFNEDGIADLAITSTSTNSVGVLLGQGDGTFPNYTNYFAGTSPVGVVVADFNGDGHQDIAVDNTGSANESVLLGAGNGAFAAQITYATGTFPYGTAVADFNGDGLPDLAVSNFSDNTGTILLSTLSETATATASSINVTGSGTHQIVASFPGNANFTASTSAALPLSGSTLLSTTTALAVSSNNVTTAQSVMLTATIAGQASPAVSGTVTFFDGSTSLGTANVTATSTGGTATLIVPSFSVGSHSITAQYGGNTSYSGSASSAQIVTVTQAPAVISSKNFGNVAVGQSVSMNITYTQGTNPTISAVNNLDFVVSTVNCSTGCVATVTFVPQYPGTREDAVTVTDSQGNLLAKTFVYGVGTAPQFGFDTGTSTLYNNVFRNADAVTLAPDGTLFVVDDSTSTVYAGSGTSFTALPFQGSGTSAVNGLAVSGSKVLYLSLSSANVVKSFDLRTGVTSTVATDALSTPGQLAVDGTGALYIADSGNGRVLKVDNQGVETLLAREAQAILGLALDSAGNVFYSVFSGSNNVAIKEIPAGGGTPTVVAGGLDSSTRSIAVDAAGKVYFVGVNGLAYVSNGQAVTQPVNGLSGRDLGVAVDSNGDLYVTQGGVYARVTRTVADNSTNPFSTSVGGTVTQNFTITNTGNAPLTFGGGISGGTSNIHPDSASGCPSTTTLAPGATCVATIDFHPTAAQQYTAALAFMTNSLNGPNPTNTLTLTGTGASPQSTPSTTTLTTISSNITVGQDALFTAKVVNTTTTNPTGAVTLYMGNSVVGSQNVQPGFGTPGTSTAGFVVSNLPAGTYTFTASYAGDTNVQASTSTPLTVTVSRVTTSTSLSVSAPTITAGQAETLTATVSGQTVPAMTGSVTFFDGSTQLGTGNITATSGGGTATFVTSTLGVGAHNITATYNGDANYTVSSSSAQTVTVNNAPTVVNSQNFGSAPVAGQPVTMTLSYPTSSGNLRILIANGLDFTSTPATCTQTACSTTVTFSPRYPGLRTDALTVNDSTGYTVAKTFLYGNGQAPQFAFDPGLAGLPFAGQVTTPQVVAIGPDSSMYVGDASNNRIIGHSAGGQNLSIAVTGLGAFGGLAVDGGNTIYVSDKTNNAIYAIAPGGAQRTVATTGLSTPGAIAVDGTGALFIADTGNNRIVKIDNQGTQTLARITSAAPVGVAVDAVGNYYYADAANGGEIVEIMGAGGSTGVSGLGTSINSLAVDAGGRYYWTALFNSTSAVYLYKLGAGPVSHYIVSSATQAGSSIAVDPQGRILIAEPTVSQLDSYDRSTGNISLTSQAGTSTTGNVILSNTGNTTLTDSSLQVSGTGFAIGSNSTCTAGAQTLTAGNSCLLILVFTPPAAQQYQGSITVTSNSLNAANTTNPFTAYGTGTSAPTSTTTLAVSPSATSVGQPVTLTATVTYTGGQPTGTVNFFDGSTMIGSATLGAGSGGTATAQFITSSLALGTHSLTAVYAGNGTAPASTSTAQGVTISQASTTTVIGASAATIAVGQPVTLTARVVAGASPAVSGTVTFFDGSTSLGSSAVTATGTGGTAQITVTNLAVGSHSITARYSGDTNYSTSTSAAQGVTVTQITSATTLAVSPATLTLGQTETLTATISGGSTNPAASGTVTFFDGTNQLGAVGITATSTGGTASLSVTTLAVGTHSITARYSGDTNYTASTSGAQGVTVTQAATTIALAVSAASISVGQSETLTATVQGLPSTLPTGTVTFFDGATSLGSVSATAQGTSSTARLAISTLAVGTHSITAVYNGDTNYTASTSAAQTVTVGQVNSSTTLGVSAATINAGQPETLTATITGAASPALTGVVTFFDGTNSLGTGNVTATSTGGTATLVVTTLAGGTHSITARYGGDTNYTASVSAAQTVTVSSTSQTITFPAIPTHTFGDAPFTLNATASSGLAVTYTVTSGPATVSGSTVTLTGAGTVVIQATQAGNTTYAAATPVSQSFNVLPPSPTLTGISPAGAVVGASATTVTLTGANFSTADTAQVNGVNIATTFVSATTLTAVVPASSLTAAATLQVAVFDSVLQKATASLPFTVSATPSVTFTGPTSTQPAQQPTLAVTLTNPYPVALTTTLTLTFAPASSSLTDDPNVQFATGGRTETFTIPANSTVTPAILLQSGTVAGKITVTLVLTNPSGVNVTPTNVAPIVITIPPVVPAISTTKVARSGNLLTVTVHAFSNTREISKAIFHFTPDAGYTVDTPDITADVSAAFAAWFSSAASQQYGSSFTYSQDFNLNNDAASVGSITVTLVNSIGQSTVGTAQ